MPAVTYKSCGRFGNQLFQYAFARGYAERHGFEFLDQPWVGQKIFDIPQTSEQLHRFQERSELNYTDGEGDVCFNGYAQNQGAMVYTRAQAQGWLKLRPEIAAVFAGNPPDEVLAHRRVGDYAGYGYVVVSEKSYHDAAVKFGLPPVVFVTEETATPELSLPREFSHFLPDFVRLMRAKTVLRGNSTFSWWAATLGSDNRIFSPVIENLPGGREHDCEFVAGNHPRFSGVYFTTDLHLPT